MKSLKIPLLLCVAIFVTGCPKYRPSVDFKNPNTLVAKINEHIRVEHARYLNALGSMPDGPAKAQLIRNELIENALPFIDSAYIDFITDIQAGRDRTNFIADLVELGASAAIGITNGERPLQILGVGLTAIRGGRRSADANFYKDTATPILISKMDGNRAKVRATILSRETKPVTEYPLGAAVADIVDYYNAGTLVRAFTELAKDTAVQTQASEDQVLRLKGVTISRVATEAEVVDAKEALAVLRTLTSSLASNDSQESAAALGKLQNIVEALKNEPDIEPLLSVAGLSSDEPDGLKLLNGLKTLKRRLPNDSPLQDKINRAIVANGK